MLRVCTLYSGSSGNSTYIGCGGTHILIDAGMSARALTLALMELSVTPDMLSAVYLTHEHIDHVRGAFMLQKKYGVPVLASSGTIRGIAGMKDVPRTEAADAVTRVGDLELSPFETPHDCVQSTGVVVRSPCGKRAAVATDLGHLPDSILRCLLGCEVVLLESNHDVRMLQVGRYPYYLKRRILSPVGHLSNEDCAAAAVRLADAGTRHLLLGHLSRENNLPELAYQATSMELCSHGFEPGRDLQLEVAPRSERGTLVEV